MSTYLAFRPRCVFGRCVTDYYRRRRNRTAERQRPSVESGGLTLATVADPEFMLGVFRDLKSAGGQAPGLDGIRYDDLSTAEIAAVLRQVARAIRERRYRPYPTRSVFIDKPNGGRRELRIATVCDRVVAAAVYQVLADTIDQVLLPTCYGFRPGRSVLRMLAAIERVVVDQNRYVIVTDDIADAFGSVVIDDAIADFHELVVDEGLRWLIETVLRGDDGASRTISIDQGSALSPATLNLRLTVCLDRPFVADPDNPLLHRWADNIVLPCSSVPEATLAIQRAHELLLPAGFRLKGDEGLPTNLRRSGAHRTILGYRVSVRDRQMHLGIPKTAWTRLRDSLDQAYLEQDPILLAGEIVQGWLLIYGMCLVGVDVRRVIRRVRHLVSSLGLREIGADADLGDAIERSRCQWEQARRSPG